MAAGEAAHEYGDHHRHLKRRSDRLFAEHRPKLIAALKSGLSTDEADQARRFFASPTGGRMLQLVASNATARETYGSMVSGKAESDAEVAEEEKAMAEIVERVLKKRGLAK